MTRSRIKHVTYRIRQDDLAESEFEARCVFGDEVECGAESGRRPESSQVDEWQRKHTQATRHNRYRRSMSDYQIWEPTEDVPPPVQPERAGKAYRA
ncbi:DUF7848 domain-containing protein [Streptomyces sp. NPDC002643]